MLSYTICQPFGNITNESLNAIIPSVIYDKEIDVVTLCKSLVVGVTEIRVGNGHGKTYWFRPAEGEQVAVTSMPPVFINLIDIANVKPDGTVINDYCSSFTLEEVQRLKMMMICQSSVPGKEVTLNVDIVDKSGASLVDKKSRQDHHISLPVYAVDSTQGMQYEIGLWNQQRWKEGCRLEIFADGQKLCSTEIPIQYPAKATKVAQSRQGTVLMYRPLAITEIGGACDEFNVVRRIPDTNLGPSLYGRDYQRSRPSTIFQVGGKTYRMTQWVEVGR